MAGTLLAVGEEEADILEVEEVTISGEVPLVADKLRDYRPAVSNVDGHMRVLVAVREATPRRMAAAVVLGLVFQV